MPNQEQPYPDRAGMPGSEKAIKASGPRFPLLPSLKNRGPSLLASESAALTFHR